MKRNTTYIILLVSLLGSCSDDKSSPSGSYELEQSNGELLVNFKDPNRTDVLMRNDYTFVARSDYQFSINYSESGDLKGYFTSIDKQAISVSDEDGDGLPDTILDKRIGKKYKLMWDRSSSGINVVIQEHERANMK